MLTAAGIDVGHQSVKVVILEASGVIAQAHYVLTGRVREAAEMALEKTLLGASVERGSVSRLFVTGMGRDSVGFAHGHPTEMSSHVRGARWHCAAARTIIDMGAEGFRVSKSDSMGNLTHFVLNDKCASGTGVFLETVASMMGVAVAEMGVLSLKATQALSLTTMCAVFAESEIVALVHRGTAREDILRAVHESIVSRIVSIAKRVGLEPDIVLTGGVARNVGVVDGLRRQLPMVTRVPENPEMVGALGAAILAAEAFGVDRSTFDD